MFRAIFFLWLGGAAQPVGMQALQSFDTRAACVAHAAPLVRKAAPLVRKAAPMLAQHESRMDAYCPSEQQLQAGTYGEVVR